MSITPTPGRVIWYIPGNDDGIARIKGQPLAAIVAAVNDNGSVNLAVFDARGVSQPRANVYIAQADGSVPGTGHAEWMPYQLGQVAKTEETPKAAVAVKPATKKAKA
jgi:hypothetical protein